MRQRLINPGKFNLIRLFSQYSVTFDRYADLACSVTSQGDNRKVDIHRGQNTPVSDRKVNAISQQRRKFKCNGGAKREISGTRRH